MTFLKSVETCFFKYVDFKTLKRESLRGSIKGTSIRPRLSVYRSNQNIYAQTNGA